MTPNERQIARSPRRVRLITAVLLVATFAAGTVMGVGVFHWVVPRKPPMPPPILAPPFPMEELDLTPEQRDQVRAIADRRRPELEAILEETYPKVRKIKDEIEEEIKVILTPEQRTRLEKVKARRPPPIHSRFEPPRPNWAHPPSHFSEQFPPPRMSQPGPPAEAQPRQNAEEPSTRNAP